MSYTRARVCCFRLWVVWEFWADKGCLRFSGFHCWYRQHLHCWYRQHLHCWYRQHLEALVFGVLGQLVF